MYAATIKFKLKSGREDEAKAAVSNILKSLKSEKGFVSAVIYFDEETNEWGRTAVWKTREDWVAHIDLVKSSERHNRPMELADGPVESKGYDVVGYATAD